MPTVLTHPAIAIGLFPWYRSQLGRPEMLLAGAILTVAPDLDVIAFGLGIPYEHMFGHRGISHSLPFAFAVSAAVAALAARFRKLHFGLLWAYFFFCMASHGLLDMLTSGGLGIALLAPFTNERYFFDLRPIRVSAIGISDFLNGRWRIVMGSELQWIWLPSIGLAAVGMAVNRLVNRKKRQSAPANAE
jgi:inner membrane protein